MVKRLLSLFAVAAMAISASAVDLPLTSEDTADNAPLYSGWSSSYDQTTQTITYEGDWTGRGWWLDGSDLADLSMYTDLVITMEANIGGQVVFQYANPAEDATEDILETFPFGVGAKKVECTINKELAVAMKQIYIQCSGLTENPTIKLIQAELQDNSGAPVEPEPEHGKFITVASQPKADFDWDTQFFFTIGEANALKDGDEWEVSFDIKADAAVDLGMAQWHRAPGEYQWWNGIPANAGTTWKTCSASGKATPSTGENPDDTTIGAFTVAFNLTKPDAANVFYFDNISFKVNGEEKIVNGDLEGDDYSCFSVKIYPSTDIVEVTEDNVTTTGIESIVMDNNNGAIYNVMGIQVDENYKGIVIKNGKKYIQK